VLGNYFIPNYSNYRKLAQKHYKLTDEQMMGMDVHHNPPQDVKGEEIYQNIFMFIIQNFMLKFTKKKVLFGQEKAMKLD
jgi:hypothetical protein